MRVSVLTVLVCLAVTPAHGQAFYSYILLPPAKYDRSFDGRVVIERHSGKELKEHCIVPDPDGVMACALGGEIKPNSYYRGWMSGVCTVHMLNDQELLVRGQRYDLVLRHEIGHCNGWTGNHEDGIVFYPTTR